MKAASVESQPQPLAPSDDPIQQRQQEGQKRKRGEKGVEEKKERNGR